MTRVDTSGTERDEQLRKLALGARGLAYNCQTGEDKSGRCDNVQCDLDTFRDALADFVDRPTVPVSFQQDSHGVYCAICSNCAYPISSFRWSYCPRCGVPITNHGV